MSAATATQSDLDADASGIAHRGLITISTMLAAMMQAIDGTIANVALPRIQGSLSATQDQMTWVLTSYIVAAAIMTPLSGWLSGRFGRKRVFLISVAGFTVASVFCGVSQTLLEIVIARLLQGLCGAALVPLSQAVILDINPPSRHARAMMIWVMGVVIGPILGPMLGGWLTENYNWRWVFFINVPVGLLSLFGMFTFMPDTPKRKSKFDFIGFIALSLAIGAFQLMLDRGQLQDWFNSKEIWLEATLAGIALYLFVVHMVTNDGPSFVSPAIFKDRNFVVGILFMAVVSGLMFGTMALLPPLLQNLLNYPVVLAGFVTAPRGLGTLLAMAVSSRLLGKVEPRTFIAAGLVLNAIAMWQSTGFYLQMDTSMVVWTGALQGFGLGFVFAPLSTITFATLAPKFRNEGTAMFGLVRNVGSSVGISIFATLLIRNSQIMHSRLAESVTPYGDFMHLQPPTALATTQGMAALDRMVNTQASMIAYNNDFKLILVLAVISVPLVAFFRPQGAPKSAAAVAVE